MSNKTTISGQNKIPKKKFYFMGQILKTDSLSLFGMQCKLQSVVDSWIGEGRVLVKVVNEGGNTLRFILYRKYEADYIERRFLPDGSFCFSDGADKVFEMDEQLIMGQDYKNPAAWIGVYASARLFYQKEQVIKTYVKAAKLNHASKIKDVAIQEFPDRLEMTIELA
jgi:hypothetical protein